LTFLSKIVERVAARQFMDHADKKRTSADQTVSLSDISFH